MSASRFAVTWDYRCPFARVAHKHLLVGLGADPGWDIHWVPFSLKQLHVGEDEPDVWDEPDHDSGLLALQVAVAVRDGQPDRFHQVHEALFDARHVESRDLRDRDVLRDVVRLAGADADRAFAAVASGQALDVVRREHEAAVRDHNVWGVPTFIVADRAVFVRLMDEPAGDVELAHRTIDRILDLLTGWPALNEYKATSIPR